VIGFFPQLEVPVSRTRCSALGGVEVVLHTHEEAHFVLLLEGAYLSSARDAPRTLHGPDRYLQPTGDVGKPLTASVAVQYR
jgi:hypothetical protein